MRALGLPFGLGSHVQWDRRLDGRIAQAFLSINAVKGGGAGRRLDGGGAAGIGGAGCDPAERALDGAPLASGRSNRAGGLEGGMTNGEDLVVRAAIKPISTVPRRMPTADLHSGEEATSFYERSERLRGPGRRP